MLRRKVFAALMVGLMVFSLAACGKAEKKAETEKATVATETEKATEKQTETKKETEKATEKQTEKATEKKAETEKATEKQTEKATEKQTEAPVETAAPEPDDGQNPIMNYVGTYVCGRASILVEASGLTDGVFTVQWPNSAAEYSEWTMNGVFMDNNVEYSNCVKSTVVFKEDGTIDSQNLDYDGGTGQFVFDVVDGAAVLYWADDQENAGEGMVFEYAN